MSGQSPDGGDPGPTTLGTPVEALKTQSQTQQPPREPGPSEWASCRCGAKWTARTTAHCAACHRTFASPGLFDRHRHTHGDHGGCLNPASLTGKDGTRVMFHRDGMWRSPEMTEQERARIRGDRT
jgi:hypothetical protein